MAIRELVPFLSSCIGTAAERSTAAGVEELLKALRRRGNDILDILVECLEEEKEANREIITKIREGQGGVRS